MILPSEALPERAPAGADVCIVGAGAAGITLACELDGSERSVLLVDAGAPGAFERAITQDPYRGSADGPHPVPHHFRRRGFGGTTRIWGGRCVPFDRIDFEPRDYVPESGWPISYEAVSSHYPRAMQYCDAGEFDFTNGCTAAGNGVAALPGLEHSGAVRADLIERYSLPLDFGKRYGKRLSKSRNVCVLTYAHAIRLRKDAGADRIEALQVGTRAGRVLDVRARAFVLALGGIETTRLLLASDPGGGGLGNRSDCLGRYYMCHLENVIGRVRPGATRPPFDFERTRDGVYCRRKIQLHEATQRKHRIPNIAFRLHYPNVALAGHGSAVLSMVYLAKRALIPEYRRILQHGGEVDMGPALLAAHARNILLGLPALAQFGAGWLAKRVLATRKLPYVLVASRDGTFPLEFNAEQAPLRDSRITLSQDLDRYGVPRVHVAWKACAEDLAGIARACRLLREEVESAHAGRVELDDGRLEERVAASAPVGGHHIGTTRMSRTPSRGVVDENCAVHGLPNLYACSSSVFPTSSHANPMLTLVALAIRLASHLRGG